MRSHISRSVAAIAALVTVGCNSLDVTNNNLPDAERALRSPSAISGIAAMCAR